MPITATKLIKATMIVAGLTAITGCATGGFQPPAFGSLVLEITDAPVENAVGRMQPGEVIAVHTVVASHAIVLEAPVDAAPRNLPEGLALAAFVTGRRGASSDLPDDPSKVLWCDVRETPTFAVNSDTCLADTDGDGRLDTRFTGQTAAAYVKFSMQTYRQIGEIGDVDVPYRDAGLSERPSRRIGYQLCPARSEGAPPSFSFVVEDRSWREGPRPCLFGQWADLDARDAVTLPGPMTVRLGEEGAFTLEGRFAAGTLDELRPGSPPANVGDPEAELARRMNNVREFVAGGLQPVGDPDIREGRLMRGDAFLTQAVEHGRTGRLVNRITRSTYFGIEADALEIGTPLYAAPLTSYASIMGISRGEVDVTWCAPVNRASDGQAPRWEAVCLPFGSGRHRWVESSSAFYVTALRFSSDSNVTDRPIVDEQPVDFGVVLERQMTFERWRGDRVEIAVRVGPRSEIAREAVSTRRIPRQADGSALVIMDGHRFRLTEPAAGGSNSTDVEYLGPVAPASAPEAKPADSVIR